MLAGLRSLKVEDIVDNPEQLQYVGRLVGSCSSVSKLTLEATYHAMDTTPLLQGVEDAAAAVAAAAAAGALSSTGMSRASLMPALRHLELVKPMPGLVDGWASRVGCSQLRTLVLSTGASRSSDLGCLTGCSMLRELEVQERADWWRPRDARGVLVLPAQLTQLKALTKLTVANCNVDERLQPVLWRLTQLCHLSLAGCRSGAFQHVSSEISSLRSLRSLVLSHCFVVPLGEQLGRWLPKLEQLHCFISRITEHPQPQDLGHLTSLTSVACRVTSVADVEHLLQLKELRLLYRPAAPPYPGLGRLTALEVLDIDVSEGSAVVAASPLPCLRVLDLTAGDPVRVASQLLGQAQHLTHLTLWGHKARVGGGAQLGVLSVLPVLKQLALYSWHHGNMVGAGAWLQQQPQLTSLVLRWHGKEMLSHLGAFPHQLQHLCLHVEYVDEYEHEVPGGLPESVTQLTRLHTLHLDTDGSQLPPWLSSLTSLQVLIAPSDTLLHHWEVVGKLPLLRHVEEFPFAWAPLAPVLRDAPHLCWGCRGASLRLQLVGAVGRIIVPQGHAHSAVHSASSKLQKLRTVITSSATAWWSSLSAHPTAGSINSVRPLMVLFKQLHCMC
jgi:hypothetical protein